MANEQFNKLGHPGKFSEAVNVSGTAWFTGSAYGAVAVIRGTGASGSLVLSGGGTVDVEDLDAGIIHELGIQNTIDVGGGNFYVLKYGGGN